MFSSLIYKHLHRNMLVLTADDISTDNTMKKLIRVENKKNDIFICLLPILLSGQTTRTLKKTELTTCYVLAIGDYIKAVNKEFKISPG
jgi:hypothetical protein